MGNFFSKNKMFARFAASQFLSLSGGFIQNVALSGIVAGFGRWQLGVFLCVCYLPVFALSFFTSKLAVKPTLLICEAVLFAMSVYLYLFPDMQFFGFCIFGGLWGTVRAFETPAASSATKLLCEKDSLSKAVRIYSLSQSVSRASGPLLCGLVSVSFGYRAAFLVNALTYIPSFILLCTVKPKEPEKADTKERPIINKPLFASVFLLSFCGISYNLVFGGVIERLGIDKSWLAWFMAAVGIGASLAFLFKKRSVLWGAGIPFCLALLIFAGSRLTVLAIAVLHGACDYLFFSFALTKINLENKDASLKRAMGVYTALSTGALPLGYLVLGFINQGFGINIALCFCAASTGLTALLIFGKIR